MHRARLHGTGDLLIHGMGTACNRECVYGSLGTHAVIEWQDRLPSLTENLHAILLRHFGALLATLSFLSKERGHVCMPHVEGGLWLLNMELLVLRMIQDLLQAQTPGIWSRFSQSKCRLFQTASEPRCMALEAEGGGGGVGLPCCLNPDNAKLIDASARTWKACV